MVNTYPRPNGGLPGGSQTPAPYQPARPSGGTPKPANDNWRLPANDNEPPLGKPPAPERLPRNRVPRGFTRRALRFLPYLGAAFTAYEFYRMYAGGQPHWDTTGYNVVNDCHRSGGSIAFAELQYYDCAASFLSTGQEEGVLHGTIKYGFGIFRLKAPEFNKWEKVIGYEKPSNKPLPPPPEYVPGKAPQWVAPPPPAPGFYPAADPDAIPIGKPAPAPRPIPHDAIPHRAPSGFPQGSVWGNSVPGTNLPNPGSAPTTTVEVGSGAEPGSVTQSRPGHEYRPPRAREKERKFAATVTNVLGPTVERIISGVTEAADFVDALYDALPQADKVHFWYKKPGWKQSHYVVKNSLTPQQKAAQLYKVIGKQSGQWFSDALQNLVMNEIEDRVIGRISRGASGLNREVGRDIGIQVGPAL